MATALVPLDYQWPASHQQPAPGSPSAPMLQVNVAPSQVVYVDRVVYVEKQSKVRRSVKAAKPASAYSGPAGRRCQGLLASGKRCAYQIMDGNVKYCGIHGTGCLSRYGRC